MSASIAHNETPIITIICDIAYNISILLCVTTADRFSSSKNYENMGILGHILKETVPSFAVSAVWPFISKTINMTIGTCVIP